MYTMKTVSVSELRLSLAVLDAWLADVLRRTDLSDLLEP